MVIGRGPRVMNVSHRKREQLINVFAGLMLRIHCSYLLLYNFGRCPVFYIAAGRRTVLPTGYQRIGEYLALLHLLTFCIISVLESEQDLHNLQLQYNIFHFLCDLNDYSWRDIYTKAFIFCCISRSVLSKMYQSWTNAPWAPAETF